MERDSFENIFEHVEKRASKLPSECTTIIVGEEQSTDGAKYLCRSSDFDALMAINIEVHEDTKFGPEEFVAKDSKFRCHCLRRLWDIQDCQIISSLANGEAQDSIRLVWA